jgi:hypothetical protein
MGMEVMQGSYGLQWVPVTAANGSFDTLYVGQMVTSTADGVAPLGAPGAAGATISSLGIYGVVVGTNNRTPQFDSTYKAEKITSASPHANTTEFVLHGSGLAPVGDTLAMVLVDRVGPGTVIKAPIFNNVYGTAITVGTVTTASTTGAGFTCSAGLGDFAGTVVTLRNTVYCRTGANRGVYRICDDTSNTVKTVDLYFPYDIAVGDTFVNVHLRPLGLCAAAFDGESTYLNAYTDTGTNYYNIEVLALDLSIAGQEHAIFRLVY